MIESGSTTVAPARSQFASIARRANLSVREFKREYYGKRPVIVTDLVPRWKAHAAWRFEGFRSRYGDTIVTAYGYFNGQYRPQDAKKLPLGEYIDNVVTKDSTTYPYYLRDDFSLLSQHKELWNDFAMPEYCFDWFRLLPSFMLRPGPRIFMGPKGAITNLHQDMWATNFWMAHLDGRKRWIIFPPDQKRFLYPSASNELHKVVLFDVRPDKVDLQRFPLFRETTGFDCVVEPGEIIIVPSNWIHWVISLDPTISLTHNYMGPGTFGPSLAGQWNWYWTNRSRKQ